MHDLIIHLQTPLSIMNIPKLVVSLLYCVTKIGWKFSVLFEADSNWEHSDNPWVIKMLFFSYFKDLVGREVTVELKNDLAIRGTLHSVDQYLNIKLENTRVVDEDKYPHMRSVRNCFIRGSVVRYVQLPPDGVDVELLHDATRREARGGWNLEFKGRLHFSG